MEYPGRGRDVRHPADNSVMTYRGHQVLRTLMRAYFSPAHTTGQRYIYTGSFDGSIAVIGELATVTHEFRSLSCAACWAAECCMHDKDLPLPDALIKPVIAHLAHH